MAFFSYSFVLKRSSQSLNVLINSRLKDLILKVSGERLGNTAYKPGGVFMSIVTFATSGTSEACNTDWNMALTSLHQTGEKEVIFKHNSSPSQDSSLESRNHMKAVLTKHGGNKFSLVNRDSASSIE